LEGLRGEDSIAELCRREGIAQNLYLFAGVLGHLETPERPASLGMRLTFRNPLPVEVRHLLDEIVILHGAVWPNGERNSSLGTGTSIGGCGFAAVVLRSDRPASAVHRAMLVRYLITVRRHARPALKVSDLPPAPAAE
jgi:hypothetical protein